MILMSLLVSSANLYFYCYYGNRSTNDYAKMAQLLFESNWNEQPVELQKFFKMMISNAQRPLFYHGFRMVHLNLETYLKVSWCHRRMRINKVDNFLSLAASSIGYQLLLDVQNFYNRVKLNEEFCL